VLLVTCADGPLAGASFTIARCPRVVRCVRAADGTPDILNEPDDEPRLDEEVHWYRWDGRNAGHVCARGKGCWNTVSLVYSANVRALEAPGPVNPRARAGS
jgi:hypothetical protein